MTPRARRRLKIAAFVVRREPGRSRCRAAWRRAGVVAAPVSRSPPRLIGQEQPPVGSAGRAAGCPSDRLRGVWVCVISSGTESFWGDRCVVGWGRSPSPWGGMWVRGEEGVSPENGVRCGFPGMCRWEGRGR